MSNNTGIAAEGGGRENGVQESKGGEVLSLSGRTGYDLRDAEQVT